MKFFISQVIKYRKLVLLATLIVTAALIAQLRSLRVIIDPDATLPQTHPYIATGNLVEEMFGNKLTVVIGITAKEGDIFQAGILAKVKNITDRLSASPLVAKNNITSLSARKSKNIIGTEEGMEVKPLMKSVPESQTQIDELKEALKTNPIFENLLVSTDRKTTQIVAEFKKSEGGFQAIENEVENAIATERDSTVEIDVAGISIFLSLLEKYSARMAWLFPLALLVIGLIHYEAFRTMQALVLPLVTAMLAVAWAMGFLGLMGEPFDVFNSSTPILILAIAAGHAVQILKRYYEEFAIVRAQNKNLSDQQASEIAVLQTLTKVGKVMIVACTVAALGFFSLMIFEIKSIRTFGIFTGVGVLSALVLELTFIPALRVMLPPPGLREIQREHAESFWDRLVSEFYRLSMYRRKEVYMVVCFLILVLSLGGYWLQINNSQRSYFSDKLPARVSDERLNQRMAGTNPIYVLIKGASEDAIKDPQTLAFMEGIQNDAEKNPNVGKTLSMVDMLKKMNQAMNSDKVDFNTLPSTQELAAQYLFLYSNSGEPGDFDNLVDYNYQNALITIFTRSDSSVVMDDLVAQIRKYADAHKPSNLEYSIGGGTLGGVALNEIMIHEKVLNILQIMGAVFVVSSIVFRSLLAGALILVPLIAAVFVNFGIMGLLGIPLQIATALVSAMAVGIGADYGIYMSYRLREELASSSDETKAIEKAFKSAGKATIFVSTAVAGGFGLLMLSFGFMIHIWMGFLIATAMLVSSVTALTLFPALIFSLRPNFIFQKKESLI